MKLIKTVKLNCEDFKFFLKKSNIEKVISTQELKNCTIYTVVTSDGRKLEIHETAKMYDCDAFETTLEIYQK